MSTDVVRLGHVYLTEASPKGARQAEGKRSRGAGGRVWNPGHWARAVHSRRLWAAQPSTGGRGILR